MVRTVLIWDRVQQPRLAIYCWGLHVGGFVSAVLGVGWRLGLAVLFLHAFCILPPCAYARCRLSMPTATSRASLLPSYNLQRRIGHSGIQINKKYGSLHPLCRKRSCLPVSESMLYLAAPARAKQIFRIVCVTACTSLCTHYSGCVGRDLSGQEDGQPNIVCLRRP